MHPLEVSLGYRFKNERLLERAITRRAFVNEHQMSGDSAQDALATLGDSVISTIVLKKILDASIPDKEEITNKKIVQIRGSNPTEVARRMDLQKDIHWGAGETKQEVWLKGRPLGECLEAIIGAIFLDGGLDCCESVMRYINFTES